MTQENEEQANKLAFPTSRGCAVSDRLLAILLEHPLLSLGSFCLLKIVCGLGK